MIDVKDIQGKTILSVPFNAGSLHRKKLMSEDYLLLKFSTVSPVQLDRGCYAEYNGVRYELIDFVFPTENTSTGGYDYELRLDAYYWKWKNKILMYDRQGSNRETSWKLTQRPEAHMDVICTNLAALGYDYNGTPFTHRVDPSIKELVKLVFYEGTNIIDALAIIAETWEVEWWVENSIIHLGKCEYNTALDFEIDKNVQSMSRSDSNDNFATRIYAFGSTRNLPAKYRENDGVVVQGVVQKRLMMPVGTPYVDAWPGMSQEETTEAVVVFDDVYPRRIGKISSLTIKTGNIVDDNDKPTGETYPIYTIRDNDLKNLEKKYLLDDLRLVFSSGSLNGMDFSLNLKSSDDTGTSFEINRSEDYGIFLPNESLKPNEGDEYILHGFDISYISNDYLTAAEQELKKRAEKYVEKSKEDPSVYDCQMNMVDMINNNIDLNVGDRVKLLNPTYFDENGRQSRIYGFEKHLDGSQVKYTVGNSAKYSRLAQVESEIKEIIYQGNAYSGSGGGVYVINRYDRTAPSDRNVFSSLRSMSEFLSKTKDDSAQGLIKFAQGSFFGQFIDSLIAGQGAGIHPDGRAQFESLEVRSSLKVLELIYNRLSAMEGDTIFTESGTVDEIEKMDETTYRLTIRKQWENDFTAFREGDVLRGVVNNLTVSGEYYMAWMRVLGVNTGANTITVSVYPDSEVPSKVNHPPTELMVLQRWGNAFDKSRQSTWYLSSHEGRMVWLNDVTRPVLEEHNYASFYGKLVNLSIFEGKPINYDQPYLYVRGLAVQDLIRIDYLGNPIKDMRDRGSWMANPEESYRNTSTLQDDVWHHGARWRCLTDETTEEPRWNATGWQQIEGSKDLTCELYPTNGEYFYADDVDFILHWDVKYGYITINDDIQAGDVEWFRDSGDVNSDNLWAVQHAGILNDIHITNDDIGQNFDTNGVTFKVRIFVRDGEITRELVQEFKI